MKKYKELHRTTCFFCDRKRYEKYMVEIPFNVHPVSKMFVCKGKRCLKKVHSLLSRVGTITNKKIVEVEKLLS